MFEKEIKDYMICNTNPDWYHLDIMHNPESIYVDYDINLINESEKNIPITISNGKKHYRYSIPKSHFISWGRNKKIKLLLNES